MTYVTMQSLQLLTSYTWTTQRSIELLVGAQLARWRPGQKASLALPLSNLTTSGSKCSVLKNVRVTLLGCFGVPAIIRRPAVFQRPQSDSAPG